MRVSEFNRTQPSFDLVDVRIEPDRLIFVDPNAIRVLDPVCGVGLG